MNSSTQDHSKFVNFRNTLEVVHSFKTHNLGPVTKLSFSEIDRTPATSFRKFPGPGDIERLVDPPKSFFVAAVVNGCKLEVWLVRTPINSKADVKVKLVSEMKRQNALHGVSFYFG